MGLLTVAVVACYAQYKSENAPGNTPGFISKVVAQVEGWLPERKNVEFVEITCVYQKNVAKVQQDIDWLNQRAAGFYGETKMFPCIFNDDVSLADVKTQSLKMMNATQDELVASSMTINISNDYRKDAFAMRKSGVKTEYSVITVKAMTRKSKQG